MKLSDLTDEQWYVRLNNRRMQQAREADKWWQYVDLEQPLYYVARILLEQEDKFPPLLVAWPELVLDSLEERLDVEGFRLPGQDSANEELQRTWQANDLDEGSGEAHYAALATSQSCLMVGPGEGEYPLVTVEYSDQVALEIDPRTRRPMVGLKTYREDAPLTSGAVVDHAVLYKPDGKYVEFENGKPVNSGDIGPWLKTIQGMQSMPMVPFVPMLNRPRRGVGRSELVALKPIVDGVNQTATNMMAAIESHSVPRRVLVGASEEDFVDENDRKMPLWKAALRAVWAIPHARPDDNGNPPQPIQVTQFSASDLRNFHESIKQLATIAASLYGLPPNYMGYTSDNPVSAEAIRYSLDRLVKRAERRQRTFGGSWERAMRIAWAIMGNDPADAVGLETKWRDPSTPTRASMADAAQKLAGGIPIIDREQAWEDLQYSEGQKDGMRRRFGSTGGFASTVAAGLKQLNVGSGEGIQPGVNGAVAPTSG